jgi:uncharacterized protein
MTSVGSGLSPSVSAEHSPALRALRAHIAELGSVLVCYSGGIDSALVLAVAHEQLGTRAVGMTAISPSLATAERDGAVQVAKAIGARHELVQSNEMARPQYVANGPDRCFHCKSELYEIARAKAAEWDLAAVVNGTNKDDLGDYRPGLTAADQAGVVSPLVALEFGKNEVRELARELGLTIWAKPASACLSSRIPYGSAVTRERLEQIAALEQELRALGFEHVRVRWHDKLARIELDLGDLQRSCELATRERIVAAGNAAGFAYVTLDLAGYRQGSHNEVLSGRALRIVD